MGLPREWYGRPSELLRVARTRLLSDGETGSFSIAYGEGAQRAFFRLLEAILTAFSNPLDILNWAGPPSTLQIHASRMLPSRPESYLDHSPYLELAKAVPEKPMIRTHIGLEVKLLFIYAQPVFHSSPTPTQLVPFILTGRFCSFKSRWSPSQAFSVPCIITIFLHRVYGTTFQNTAFLFGLYGFHDSESPTV
jgi:hypothetical protein